MLFCPQKIFTNVELFIVGQQSWKKFLTYDYASLFVFSSKLLWLLASLNVSFDLPSSSFIMH